MIEIIITMGSVLGGVFIMKYIKPKVSPKAESFKNVLNTVTVSEALNMAIGKNPTTMTDEIRFQENVSNLKNLVTKTEIELKDIYTQSEQDTLLLLKLTSERLMELLSSNYKVLANSRYKERLDNAHSSINSTVNILNRINKNTSRELKFTMYISTTKLLSDTYDYLNLVLKQITSFDYMQESQEIKIMESILVKQKNENEDMALTDKFNDEYIQMRMNMTDNILKNKN